MFNMKRNIVLFIMLVLILGVLNGCTSPTDTSSHSNKSGDLTTDKKTIIKFAHDYTTNSPYQESALEFKRILEEKTDGKIEVKIYPAQELGDAREMIEAMQKGEIEMVWTPTAKFADFEQKLTVLDLPFLFPNEEVMWEALEGEIGQDLMAGLEEIGIKGISFDAEGYKHFTANKPITQPEFFKGMKIRTMEAPVIISTFKAWYANPVPIDFTEVYDSLQQKIVDGQENPIISNHDMKFYELQDYISIADHAYLTYFLSASNKWFESLPVDFQRAVMQTSDEMSKFHKDIIDKANDKYMENMKAAGTKVYIMTEQERKILKELSEPIYDKYREEIGGELIDKIVRFSEERIDQ